MIPCPLSVFETPSPYSINFPLTSTKSSKERFLVGSKDPGGRLLYKNDGGARRSFLGVKICRMVPLRVL